MLHTELYALSIRPMIRLPQSSQVFCHNSTAIVQVTVTHCALAQVWPADCLKAACLSAAILKNALAVTRCCAHPASLYTVVPFECMLEKMNDAL